MGQVRMRHRGGIATERGPGLREFGFGPGVGEGDTRVRIADPGAWGAA